MTGKTRIDESRRRVSEQTQAPQGRLSFKAAGDVIGKRHDLESRPENELARVQDERLITFGLNQPSQVWLFHTRIDVRVLVVLEDPKPAVQPDRPPPFSSSLPPPSSLLPPLGLETFANTPGDCLDLDPRPRA